VAAEEAKREEAHARVRAAHYWRRDESDGAPDVDNRTASASPRDRAGNNDNAR